MAPHSIWKQAQHHLQYCLLKGSQREGRHLSGPSPISRPEWCCWSQIVLGFGFSPVVNLILQPVLIPRINSLWSSPSKHFFFSPWMFSFFYTFWWNLCFLTYASKILFFQSWPTGSLNTSQLFQGHMELGFPSGILTVHWARKLGIFCLTHTVNWNKNLKFFKLFVAECSSCFNEKVMEVKQGRVVEMGISDIPWQMKRMDPSSRLLG